MVVCWEKRVTDRNFQKFETSGNCSFWQIKFAEPKYSTRASHKRNKRYARVLVNANSQTLFFYGCRKKRWAVWRRWVWNLPLPGQVEPVLRPDRLLSCWVPPPLLLLTRKTTCLLQTWMHSRRDAARALETVPVAGSKVKVTHRLRKDRKRYHPAITVAALHSTIKGLPSQCLHATWR